MIPTVPGHELGDDGFWYKRPDAFDSAFRTWVDNMVEPCAAQPCLGLDERTGAIVHERGFQGVALRGDPR